MSNFDFRGATLAETEQFLIGLGEKKFRAAQIRQWIFDKCVDDFDSMTNVSLKFRESLKDISHIGIITEADRSESSDGTVKHLFRLEDGHTIESVWMPENDRRTLCISSQVGCKLNCSFCLTGESGFVRNLTASEIVSQVLMAKRLAPDGRVTNLVIMGMGEPFDNFGNTLQALRIMTDHDFKTLGSRKITVSTAGVVPGIERLGREFPNIKLAISLNAGNDVTRGKIMPINKTFPLAKLRQSLLNFPQAKGRKFMLEYVMLAGINDRREDAMEVSEFARGIPSTINLIPFNSCGELNYKTPEDETVRKFQKILMDRGHMVFVRKSKGQDILAACGQLREAKTNKI